MTLRPKQCMTPAEKDAARRKRLRRQYEHYMDAYTRPYGMVMPDWVHKRALRVFEQERPPRG